MRNKIKSVINFILIILIIIGLYLVLLNNVEKFTLDYDGELFAYENNYEMEYKEQKIRRDIYNSEVTTITEEEKNRILDNKVIRKVYSNEKNEEEVRKYIQEYTEKRLIADTKYGDIMYVSDGIYEIAITEDLKNLYYCYPVNTKSTSYSFTIEIVDNALEEISKNKDTVLQKINEELNAMEIQEENEFTANSILVQKQIQNGQNYNYIYVVEDTKSNTRVHYSLTYGKIIEIIVGFD